MNISKFLAAACVILAAGCGGDSGTGPTYGGGNPPPAACTPGGGTVCVVSGDKFSPTQLTVAVGSSVTFNNVSGTTHNVTFDTQNSPANTGNFASGTKVVAFPTAGTYNYHCTIHGSSMSGVVVVQ